jgi:hypothetical protein
VAEPEHAPLHPANVEPVAGLAVKVTIVLVLKLAEQVAPQLIPEGDDITVPVPVPVFETERPCTPLANVAVTAISLVMTTEQGPVPLQAPDQPLKVEPDPGDAFSVTVEHSSTSGEHAVPQLILPGPVTVPDPTGVTFSLYFLTFLSAQPSNVSRAQPISFANSREASRLVRHLPPLLIASNFGPPLRSPASS